MVNLYKRHYYLGNKRSNADGFTLLELLVVLALIGILLVVSVPSLQNSLLNNSLKTSCRKMIGQINTARALALREQVPYLLYLDLDQGSVWYEKDLHNAESESPRPEPTLQLDEKIEIRNVWTKSSGIHDGGVVELWVSRRGYMDQTMIHLENEDDEVMNLTIFPFLTVIKVRDEYVDPN